MSRFGELSPGYDREVADASRYVIDAAEVAAANAEYAARQQEIREAVSAAAKAATDTATEMGEAVRTINYVLEMLRHDGLEISTGYRLEIKSLYSRRGYQDGVVCPGVAGPQAKELAAQAVAIYRDSADTQEMGDRVADIFGLLGG